jgi:4-amino-4-deoxy-L-arabinose transferase-like glycosyltransferase
MKFSVSHGIKSLWQFGKAHPAIVRGLSILWLLAICWLAFFRHLGSIGLIDETEPLFAEAARQMIVTGDWITPFFNGETRFDKPPLIYWLMAIAYQLFGVNEWAVRLPSALAALALTSFCFCALRYFGLPYSLTSPSQSNQPRETGLATAIRHKQDSNWPLWVSAWLGAAILVFNPYIFFWGRVGYSDMLLSACLGGALLAFFFGYAQPERQVVQVRWYLIFYTLIALAVLTKGPVGIVLPGLIIGCFLLYLGKGREVLREMRLLPGVLIVLGLTVPWYILVISANGQAYINSFFGYHNLERFTSVVNYHSGPWYFHLVVVLVGFIPWSIYLPAAIARVQVLNRRSWQAQPRSTHLGLFALFWFLVVLGFFTIAATKYFSYVLPLIPAAAILVALWWSDQITQGRSQPYRWDFKLSSLFNLGLFLVLAVVSIYSPNWLGNDPSMPNLGLRLQQTHLLVVGAVIWAGSAIAGGALLLRRRIHWLWSVNLIGYIAFLVFVITPALFIVDAERQLPLRQIAQTAVEVERPAEELIMIVNGFPKPSLVFYTQQPVTYLLHPSEAIPYVRKLTGRSPFKSTLIVASDEALKQTGLKPNQYQEISQAGVYQLVRVSSNLE